MTLYFCVEHSNGIKAFHKMEFQTFSRKVIKEFERMIEDSNDRNPHLVFKPALESCVRRLAPNIIWTLNWENDTIRYSSGA